MLSINGERLAEELSNNAELQISMNYGAAHIQEQWVQQSI